MLVASASMATGGSGGPVAGSDVRATSGQASRGVGGAGRGGGRGGGGGSERSSGARATTTTSKSDGWGRCMGMAPGRGRVERPRLRWEQGPVTNAKARACRRVSRRWVRGLAWRLGLVDGAPAWRLMQAPMAMWVG